MLIRFSSVATESIIMFGDTAMLLIKMLGASDALPGAIGADDIPAAVTRLKEQLNKHLDSSPANAAESLHAKEDGDKADYEPPIALASRAGPLMQILERAVAAQAPVMWEKA
jgi:hypothetical protein